MNSLFWVSGNQRSGGDFAVSAILADGWQELNSLNLSLAYDSPWVMYTLNFTLVDELNPVKIHFNNSGGDNIGMMLDDVTLISVPEPSIIALFGLGLLGMEIAGRRRKTK